MQSRAVPGARAAVDTMTSMHDHPLERWRHEHDFLGADHERNERRTRLVIALTLVMMVAEIAAGLITGSMALLADGWHMATHAGALALSAAAYAYARRHAKSSRYVFGTGKVGDLAGFASAVLLAAIAALIAFESIEHLLARPAIRFDEAIFVATIGLGVNMASALILGHWRGHGHEDVYPVCQFEKLWGDMTALSGADCGFVAVPRVRGQQLKDPAQLDGWLRDGSAEHVRALCAFPGANSK